MLTVKLAVILLLSIVLTRTKEISATSCKNVVFGAGTEYDQVESCCLIGKHSYYSLDRAVGSTVVFSQVSGDVYVNNQCLYYSQHSTQRSRCSNSVYT